MGDGRADKRNFPCHIDHDPGAAGLKKRKKKRKSNFHSKVIKVRKGYRKYQDKRNGRCGAIKHSKFETSKKNVEKR